MHHTTSQPNTASNNARRTAWTLLIAATLGGMGPGFAFAQSHPSTQAKNTAASSEISKTLRASFADRGIATLERLDQTELQAACSKVQALGKPVEKVLSKAQRERLQQAALASVKYPEDGKFIGDWREGEKIAQNGRGLQFSDAAGAPNGGNCYACHQLSAQELSFGNIGPSLLRYGLNRGVTDPGAKDAEPLVKYTWQRIWNTHAFKLCANMPRFGDAGILTTEQLKNVMALLLDPQSPVNQSPAVAAAPVTPAKP